jgi:hypothetical protein
MEYILVVTSIRESKTDRLRHSKKIYLWLEATDRAKLMKQYHALSI